MPVNLSAPNKADITAIKGIKLASTPAGIKANGTPDLVLIELAQGSSVASVYTQNAFCAAPVIVAKQHQLQTTPRYLLINAGNANAGTGQQGLEVAQQCCQRVAKLGQVSAQSVLPFSTGVIGEQLPVEKIEAKLPVLFEQLSEKNWFEAAHAIMTTDTVAKLVSRQIEISGKKITVTGMAKGSGMIRPDMATMLSYIATDADVEQSVLNQMLQRATDQSFNRISVDGDTSTNDACVLIATGKAGDEQIIDFSTDSAQQLYQVIADISQQLAHAIVRDGEGATKFVAIEVEKGRDKAECEEVAYTIAHSPLVKTALFASDPNWGRILAAVGRSGLAEFDLTKVDIYLDDVALINKGEPDKAYTEEAGQAVMNQDEITIKVILNRGQANDTVWTCDFSYGYVKINAEYRS
ncbi:MAG: bifunctional glutamate N-acetyltransferase/amino-acid acetyltransferase ArgJ [Marinomonas atlantica]|nr:bifunctional glutamate N-acetyltransferase/amino-acid acetyltransferase ArgJ [Marinomonas atlantica]